MGHEVPFRLARSIPVALRLAELFAAAERRVGVVWAELADEVPGVGEAALLGDLADVEVLFPFCA